MGGRSWFEGVQGWALPLSGPGQRLTRWPSWVSAWCRTALLATEMATAMVVRFPLGSCSGAFVTFE